MKCHKTISRFTIADVLRRCNCAYRDISLRSSLPLTTHCGKSDLIARRIKIAGVHRRLHSARGDDFMSL